MPNRGTGLSCAFVALALLASTLISGCGMGTPAVPSAGRLSGRAIGGNFPVVGGRVYLFAAGNAGYGGASTPLLINDGVSPVQTDGNNNTYVLTDANGNFDVTGEYACNNTTDQVYVLIAGGNPGLSDPSTDNEALALMAALGPCGLFNGSSTLTLDPSTYVVVNEVTTVASVYALSQFMLDATHIGTDSHNLSGLANAFATVNNLVTNSSGSANTTLTQTGSAVSKTVTAPHDVIDYLADMLIDCVNSDGTDPDPATGPGTTGTTCDDLFTASGDIPANSNFPAGSTPTDTIQATLAIARTPAANEHARWVLPTPEAMGIFGTGSLAEPNDWSLVLTYTGGNNEGQNFVLDANGALWSTDTGATTVFGISNNGTPLTSTAGLYNSSPLFIDSMAFDTHDDLWLDETDGLGDGNSDLKQFDTTSTSGLPLQTVSGPGTYLDQTDSDPETFIIDGNNNIWIWMFPDIDFAPGSINMLTAGDGYQTQTGFPSMNGGFINNYDLIVDGGSDLFAGGQFNPGIAGITGSGSGFSGAPFVTSLTVSSMALDGNGNICFVAADPDVAGFDVYRQPEAGPLSPPLGDASEPVETQSVNSMMVDGNSNIWLIMSSAQTNLLAEVDSNNTVVESLGGTSGGSLNNYSAIDSSGNIWLASQNGSTPPVIYTLIEYVGAAGPVQTPVSEQILFGSIGKFPTLGGI